MILLRVIMKKKKRPKAFIVAPNYIF